MYASEKYVKMEVKELRHSINELANDLGGEIKYLHQEIIELVDKVNTLEQQLITLGNENES